ncbi:MAG TPA: zinc ribbon domain-containing protein [Tepidisphaeraceae bacterium]|nr:zinc ribbon domain-containing protein [Tepidisphaeraceae bacterium]
MRRLLRWAFDLTAVVSAVLFVGLCVLWERSYRHTDERIVRERPGVRYTLRSERGRVALIGPPAQTNTEDEKHVYALVSRLANDDLYWEVDLAPPGQESWVAVGPVLEAPASDIALRRVRPSTRADVIRPLLLALDDPRKFAAAHFVLLWLDPRESEPGLTRRPEVVEGLATDWPAVTFQGVRMRLQAKGLERDADDRLSERLRGEPVVHIDPATLPAIRDRWHHTFKVPIWSTPLWRLAGVTAFLPLTWCLWHSLPAARRGSRLRAGLCPSCGYDLRASADRCPECGTSISQHKSAIV